MAGPYGQCTRCRTWDKYPGLEVSKMATVSKEEYDAMRKKYRGKRILDITKDEKGVVHVKLGLKMRYRPVGNR